MRGDANVYLGDTMNRLSTPLLLLAVAGFATEVRYTNEAAQTLQGARLPALAGVTLGLPPDPGSLGRSPAGLAEYEHPELVAHHAVLYSGLGATQDEILLVVPLQERLGLGVAASRVGADGIMRVDEGEDPDFDNPRTFSASDWIGTLGVGRSWFGGRLLGGTAVRFLLRDLDQTGIGAQTEASVVWKSPLGWRAGARLERGFGSFASWESGRREYSPAELMIGGGLEKKMPYFYGRGLVGWESPGLIHGEANTSFTDKDTRIQSDPWLFLRASRLAGEFQFDFGGVLRAGCEVQALTRLTDFLQDKDEEGLFGESRGTVSFGAGYLWDKRARVDYALVVDPDLGSMHRVALGLVFGVARNRKSAVAEDAPSSVVPDSAIVPPPAPAVLDSAAVVKPTAPSTDSLAPADAAPAPTTAPAPTPAADDIPPEAPAPSVPPTPSVVPASPAIPVAPDAVVAPVPAAQAPVPAPSAVVPAPATPAEPAPVVAPPAPPASVAAPPALSKPAPAKAANPADDEWDAPETTE